MSKKKKSIRRFKANYASSVISMAFVLFMLGILAMMFSSGRKLADEFKENLRFTVIIKDNVDEKSILILKDTLEKQPWVKSADYISKEDAAKIFTKDTGEDFKDLLDENPLYASIELKLPAGYTSQDSIDAIQKRVMIHLEATEFYFDQKLVTLLNDRLKKISWIIIGISVVLMAVAITILDSTVRLSMYAHRMIIRSMQLVGATRSFITKPFLYRSIINGSIASLIAIFLLSVFMKLATSQVADLEALQDMWVIGLIFAGIVITGLLFSSLSTLFAVRKYLRMKIDELY